MKERNALAGSLIAGLLASICCIGPLVLGAVGLGSRRLPCLALAGAGTALVYALGGRRDGHEKFDRALVLERRWLPRRIRVRAARGPQAHDLSVAFPV